VIDQIVIERFIRKTMRQADAPATRLLFQAADCEVCSLSLGFDILIVSVRDTAVILNRKTTCFSF
jgi:hypothetical protein